MLGQIFALFANRAAVVVCLSDHGDEVYDYRGGIGRRDDDEHPELMVQYQHSIPFVVWCSPRLQQTHPQVVERIRQATERPGTLDNVSQMLLDISGIATPWYHAERDILSPTYQCPKRVVREKYDYDELAQQVE